MPDFSDLCKNGLFAHCPEKLAIFPEKSEFSEDVQKHRYLNVVYKVPNYSCITAIFPADLNSSEVISWDDLSRGI